MQLESTKVYFLGRLKIQTDLEEELRSEETRYLSLTEQRNALVKDIENASEQVREYEDRLQETS